MPPKMTPEKLVEAQLTLAYNTDMRPELMRKSHLGTMTSVMVTNLVEETKWNWGDDLPPGYNGDDPKVKEDMTTEFLKAASSAAKEATLYRVDSEMATLVQHAARQLEPVDLCDVTLIPTDDGLVRFETPIVTGAPDGLDYKIHWVLWRTITPRHDDGSYENFQTDPNLQQNGKVMSMTLVWFFNDPADPDTSLLDVEKQLRAKGSDYDYSREYFNGFRCLGGDVYTGGRFVGYDWDDPRGDADEHIMNILDMNGEHTRTILVPQTTTGKSAFVPDLVDDPTTITLSNPHMNPRRFLHALWLMMNQPSITDIDRATPVRKHHRQLSEREIGRTPSVTTVRLRRNAEANPKRGESTVQWTKRWVVRGHWRWQPYGPGREQRRRRWIAPYLKGDDQLPLVVTKKVYDVKK